jgi:hypothetical protein
MRKKTSAPTLLAICALALTDCGGGMGTAGIEGTGSPNPVSPNPISPNPQASSPAAADGLTHITGLIDRVGTDGLVQLGTALITTNGAAVYVDGVPGTPDDIQANRVATIVGKLDLQTLSGPARDVYLHSASANAGIPAVHLGVFFEQYPPGHWKMYFGPEFSLDANATVLIDGEPASIAGLAIGRGEVVLLSGVQSFDAAHNPGGLLAADRLELTHLVDGPVDSIDPAHSRLTVLGQTVLVADSDCFDLECFSAVYLSGTRMTVSGFSAATGEIVATRVVPSVRTGGFQVVGFVKSIDKINHQLAVGGLSVDYSRAALHNFPWGSPENGDRVVVRGTRVSGGPLAAADITYSPGPLPGEPGSIASLRALVTEMSSPSSLSVDGHPVQLSLAASQTLATCPDALAPSREVTLDGQLLADGTMLADFSCPELTFDAADLILTQWISAPVDFIDSQFGTLTILGFQILTSVTTQFVGVPDVASLKIGDYVNANLTYAPVVGSWNASAIQLTTAEPSRVNAWSGRVGVADPLIYINERPMTTNGSTTFRISFDPNHSAMPLDRATFFGGPQSWPMWDLICGGAVQVTVVVQPDGSLLVVDVLLQPDYC